MLQELFTVPGLGLPIYGFGAMLFLALMVAISLAGRCARRSGIDPEILSDLAIWVVLGGLIGARAFYVIQHRDTLSSVWDAFKIWEGGIVLYGSLIGGAVGFIACWWVRRFPIRPVMDAIAPSMAVGIALGRVGCFLNGCCYGDRCDPDRIPWAVTFPARTLPWLDHVSSGLIPEAAARSLPVHPTQLYSAIDGLIILAMLLSYYPLRRRDGEVMALLAVTYPVTRFLIELLRDDEGAILFGMTISQNISLLLLALGAAFWLYLSRLPRGRLVDRQGVRDS